MKERPILFQGAMVRALLDGSKTQTRRVVNPRHLPQLDLSKGGRAANWSKPMPYGQPGDRLWVKETFQRFTDDAEIMYAADPKSLEAMNDLKRDECLKARWRASIFMPRWASRITVEVTGVRVERLQEISEADAIAEGIEKTPSGFWSLYGQADVDGTYSPRTSYRALWESINSQTRPVFDEDGKRIGNEPNPARWEANPWVWVIDFKRLKP
jgi:hypothetical protein